MHRPKYMQTRAAQYRHSRIYMMDKNKHRRRKKALSVALAMHIFTGKTPPFKARGVNLIDDGSAVCAVQYHGDGD